MIKMYIGRHVKCPLLLSDFNETRFFFTDFRKTLNYHILGKILHRYPSCSTRTDGQADMTELITVFRSFENALKNGEVH